MFGREMSDSRVETTLVICTYNRRDSLSETLDTVATQRAAQSWEVLVGERAPSFPSPRRVRRILRESLNFVVYPGKAALGPREMSVRLYNLTQRARAWGMLAQLLRW